MQGVGGVHHSGFSYPAMKAVEQAPPAGSTAPGSDASGSTATSNAGANTGANSVAPGAGPSPNPLSGQNAVAAMLGNGETITGGVTATLPDGMTIGVWSLSGADPSQDGSASGSGSGSDASGSASGAGPDYAAMETALEQMVDQFMANSTASGAAAASQAYGAPPISAYGAAQGGGANVVA